MNEDTEMDKMTIILDFIKKHEKMKVNLQTERRVTEKDIFGQITHKKVIKEPTYNDDKVLAFRMQEEFGPKKRIKP